MRGAQEPLVPKIQGAFSQTGDLRIPPGSKSSVASQRVRPLTLERYEGVVRKHVIPALGDVRLSDGREHGSGRGWPRSLLKMNPWPPDAPA